MIPEEVFHDIDRKIEFIKKSLYYYSLFVKLYRETIHDINYDDYSDILVKYVISDPNDIIIKYGDIPTMYIPELMDNDIVKGFFSAIKEFYDGYYVQNSLIYRASYNYINFFDYPYVRSSGAYTRIIGIKDKENLSFWSIFPGSSIQFFLPEQSMFIIAKFNDEICTPTNYVTSSSEDTILANLNSTYVLFSLGLYTLFNEFEVRCYRYPVSDVLYVTRDIRDICEIFNYIKDVMRDYYPAESNRFGRMCGVV